MKRIAAIVGVVLGLNAVGANAALINRGGGMIYDTTLNITWLADWNYALTSGYAVANAGGTGTNKVQVTGEMGWNAAQTWANNLVYGGYSDWRLPSALNRTGSIPCSYNGCNGSEMGHMYYDDWGSPVAGPYSLGSNAANFALFSNVKTAEYWSGTEFGGDPWFFSTRYGNQGNQNSFYAYYAVAVRDGDVSASVPEPAALGLLSLSLGVMCLLRRRNHV